MGLVVLREWLNLMILVDFSTINDSMTYAVEVVIK